MPDCKAVTLSVCSVDRWAVGDWCMVEKHGGQGRKHIQCFVQPLTPGNWA